MKITALEITINGNPMKVDYEEAREIWESLNQIFSHEPSYNQPLKETPFWNPIGPVTCHTNDNGE